MGFPGGSVGKEFTCNEGDLGSVPGLGRFQYSSLKNSGTEEPDSLQSVGSQRVRHD